MPLGWGSNLSWLVYNRAKNECLDQAGSEGEGGAHIWYNDSVQKFKLRVENTNMITSGLRSGSDLFTEPEWAQNWGGSLEISFFSSEPCGRISFPYEEAGVNLVY